VKSLQLADSIDSQLVSSEVACRQLTSSEDSSLAVSSLPVMFPGQFFHSASRDAFWSAATRWLGLTHGLAAFYTSRVTYIDPQNSPISPARAVHGGKAVDACSKASVVYKVLF